MSIVNYNYASNAAANVITSNEKLMDKTMAGSHREQRWVLVMLILADTVCIPTCLWRPRKPGQHYPVLNSGLARMKLVEATGMTIHKMAKDARISSVGFRHLLPVHDRYGHGCRVQALLTEWNRLATQTSYNGVAVMTGTDLVIRMGEAGGATDYDCCR